MSAYYYLVSSLPMLLPQTTPPLTIAELEAACGDKLSRTDLQLLQSTQLLPVKQAGGPSASADWNDWEVALRNQIAVSRSGRGDSKVEQLPEKGCYTEINHLVQEAFAIDNPLEREKYLDRARWNRLDELESGHHFDLDKLCLYKLKLLLLEKWQPRQTEGGSENFTDIVKTIVASRNEKDAE